MYTIKVEIVLQQCKRLCSKKLKRVKISDYREVKSELSVRWPFLVNFCRYIGYFKKLIWFPSVTYLGPQTGRVWANRFFDRGHIFRFFFDFYWHSLLRVTPKAIPKWIWDNKQSGIWMKFLHTHHKNNSTLSLCRMKAWK